MRIPIHLPPIRIIRTPICHTFSSQRCRPLHLMSTCLDPKISNKIVRFKPASPLYKQPQDLRIDLVDNSHNGEEFEPIKQITLADILKNHVKPGLLLVPSHPISSEQQYYLRPIDTKNPPSQPKSLKRPKRNTKEFHFSFTAPVAYFTIFMYTAWHTLQAGIPVEIHVHGDRARQRSRPGNADYIEWYKEQINHNLHLRPDVILKAMPEASWIQLEPVSDRNKVCWMIGPPEKEGNESAATKQRPLTKIFRLRQRQIVWEQSHKMGRN